MKEEMKEKLKQLQATLKAIVAEEENIKSLMTENPLIFRKLADYQNKKSALSKIANSQEKALKASCEYNGEKVIFGDILIFKVAKEETTAFDYPMEKAVDWALSKKPDLLIVDRKEFERAIDGWNLDFVTETVTRETTVNLSKPKLLAYDFEVE